MRLVSAEGTTFYYFSPSENWAPPAGMRTLGQPPERVMEQIRMGGAIRLAAFVPALDQMSVVPYFLFWPTDTDLASLDSRVRDGGQTDADFEGSVRTVYQHTHCSSCGQRWHTLVIPAGDPYPGAPGLLQRKIANNQYLRCPNCKSSLRQLVVCVFHDSPPESR